MIKFDSSSPMASIEASGSAQEITRDIVAMISTLASAMKKDNLMGATMMLAFFGDYFSDADNVKNILFSEELEDTYISVEADADTDEDTLNELKKKSIMELLGRMAKESRKTPIVFNPNADVEDEKEEEDE